MGGRKITAGRESGETKEFLSFKLGEDEYGIDILSVQEIRPYEKPTPVPDSAGFIRGVINLRGAIVPIVDLRSRFRMSAPGAGGGTAMIILNLVSRTVGVLVDGVSDVLRLKAGEIHPPPDLHFNASNHFIQGLASRGERLVILLRVEEFAGAA